jgi:glycosyltransferase involved in cell wall biosynthesis
MAKPILVIPCYNEEERLDCPAFETLLAGWDLLFVNDGSTDATGDVIDAFASTESAVTTLHLAENRGKAEAVRAGLLEALDRGAGVVGYGDADLATPPDEFQRLLAMLDDEAIACVLGSRVQLLGRNVERSRPRHWLGRLFATAASALLDLPVYDTQCGAKVFRATPQLSCALGEPFGARWAFDVELLGRLLVPLDGSAGLPQPAIVEVPLRSWRDVGGSKLSRRAMFQALRDLARIGTDLRRRR